MKLRYFVIAIVVLTCWLGLTAGSASGTSIYQRSGGCDPAPCDDSDLVYAAGSEFYNNVVITQSGGTYRFREIAPVRDDHRRILDLHARVADRGDLLHHLAIPRRAAATFDVDAELHDGDDQSTCGPRARHASSAERGRIC